MKAATPRPAATRARAAIEALAGRVPPGADVIVPGPLDPPLIQYARLRAGPRAIPGFGPYRILRAPAGSGPAYLILHDRNGFSDPVLRAVAAGKERELWRAVMPPGDPACVLIAHDGLGARAPAR